jgi:ketosteroid isomerase-like protein
MRIIHAVLLAFLIVAFQFSNAQNSKTNKALNQKGISRKAASDTTQIKEMLDKYAESIDNADTLLGAALWAKTKEVSFIHPRGHEHGWENIKNNIYKFFGTYFSKRKLNIYDIRISSYGDVAWTEFYWIYDATFKNGTVPIQTKGRESQIWRKINNEWLLVHVHYSGMPVTGAKQGF